MRNLRCASCRFFCLGMEKTRNLEESQNAQFYAAFGVTHLSHSHRWGDVKDIEDGCIGMIPGQTINCFSFSFSKVPLIFIHS